VSFGEQTMSKNDDVNVKRRRSEKNERFVEMSREGVEVGGLRWGMRA
jgi:hypothetical protein